MTKRDALAEARRRWGKAARVWTIRTVARPNTAYAVSNNVSSELGCGDTWEAAFADADRREKGEGNVSH